MNTDIFEEIKSRINLQTVVTGYGIEINRSGFCLCPFHAEKTPSMKIYDNGFKCYGCGEGGDMFVFVQKLFNLENPLDAAKKINNDFGLNVEFNHKPTRQEFLSAKNIVRERQEFEHEEKVAINAFTEYFKILRDFNFKYAPKTPGEVPDKRFIEYCNNMDKLDYTLNRFIELSHSPMNERKAFLKENENYLVEVAERILEIHKEQKLEKQELLENTLSENESKQKSQQQGDKKRTVVINAFGGPGAGKTTACLHIAAQLKKRGFVAEYVQEYAKELTWDKNFEMLDGSPEHQKLIFAEQAKRLNRLVGKVDFVVTDAPLLLNSVYLDPSYSKKQAYTKAVMERFQKYDNFCFVVGRDTSYFETIGRTQSLEESIQKDNEIVQLLKDNQVYFKTYSHDELNKVVDNAVKTHNRITGLKQEVPVGQKISPAQSKGDIIGNTPYRNIENKSYLKFSSVIAPKISDILTQKGIPFSGRVQSRLTTFTVNSKDLEKLRSIANAVTNDYVNRNSPQIIPSLSSTNTKQKSSMQNSKPSKAVEEAISI